MGYYNDAISQLESILKYNANKEIVSLYKQNIEEIFCGIYMINYVSNRIEFKKRFSSDYFNISFSCLIESFSLILNNYPRGASLVLRSSLENFIKFIIQANNKTNFKIDDKIYTNNKATLDRIIEAQDIEPLKKQYFRANSKMQKEYDNLSGISHSLTLESKSNTVDYFSDLSIVNKNSMILVLQKIKNIINQMFVFCIMIGQPSFKIWDSFDLEKIFRMVFGKKKTRTFLKLIKL